MKNRKLLSFLVALAFVFSALGFVFAPSSALAANPGPYLEGDAIPPNPLNPNCSTYEVIGEPTSTDLISVTLIVEAGDALDGNGDTIAGTAFRKEITTNIGGRTDPNSVTSLLFALNGTNGLTFYGKGHTVFTNTTNYLGEVDLSGDYNAAWEEGFWGFDGWVFRVNDKFPVRRTADLQGWEGTGILETPLVSGDVVHLFYDFPSNLYNGGADLAANYVRAVFDEFDATDKTVKVKLQGHLTYIDPSYPYTMSVFNYVNLGHGLIAGLYKEDGTLVQKGQPSRTDGTVTFTNNNLGVGTYIVKTVPAYYPGDPDNPYDAIIDNWLFTLTGAYSKIEVKTTN